jgi:hypothetical protein
MRGSEAFNITILCIIHSSIVCAFYVSLLLINIQYTLCATLLHLTFIHLSLITYNHDIFTILNLYLHYTVKVNIICIITHKNNTSRHKVLMWLTPNWATSTMTSLLFYSLSISLQLHTTLTMIYIILHYPNLPQSFCCCASLIPGNLSHHSKHENT